MDIDVSIIIVTYNGRDFALKTLASYHKALAADQQRRYEIIVVDNASQDGVADAVAEGYPELPLIRNVENFGFSKANNIGFEASRGRYVLFSNADVEVTEQTLPTLITLMDQNPRVGACNPFLKLVKTGEIDWGSHRGFPTPWAAFTYYVGLERLCRRSKRLSRIFGRYHLLDRDLSQAHEVDAVKGAFFLVRREIFEQAGRWDEAYFMFGEDIDLCYQVKKLGYKVMFYPQAQALHYHGVTTGLKKHSQDVSVADRQAQERAYHAFYDAMKIFYDKNYQDRYNPLARWPIFLAIEVKRRLGVRSRTV
jgi:GT2 family glycosyltransferase